MELIVIIAVAVFVHRLWARRRPEVSRIESGLVGPVGWVSTIQWTTVRPLLRADVRRVVLHPAFVFGVAITWGIMLLAATAEEGEWLDASAGIALGLVPLGWMTIIASNLTALRPRRLGTEELFASLPAPQPVRTTALLLTSIGPGIVASLYAIGAVVWLQNRDEPLPGSPLWQEIAVGVLIVVGAVAVGVTVARFVPNGMFGVLAVVAVTLIQARVFELTAWPWHTSRAHPARFLAFLTEPSRVADQTLEFRPTGAHLVYLFSWTLVVAMAGLLRDRGSRPAVALLVLGVLAVAGSGWVQTRPLSDASRDRMVSYLLEPDLHQVCREAGAVRYCAYPDYGADIDGWRATTESVLAQFPDAAIAGAAELEVVQRPATIIGTSACGPSRFRDNLHPAVASRVDPARLWADDGAVHPSLHGEAFPCSDRDDNGFFLAVQVASWAMGLPPAPHHDDERCTATGQARSAIAMWAAAAATPDGARILADVRRDGSDGKLLVFTDWDNPPMWGVTFANVDVQVALAMLDLPNESVRSVLGQHWDRLSEDTTSTAFLSEVTGVDLDGALPPAGAAGVAKCP